MWSKDEPSLTALFGRQQRGDDMPIALPTPTEAMKVPPLSDNSDLGQGHSDLHFAHLHGVRPAHAIHPSAQFIDPAAVDR